MPEEKPSEQPAGAPPADLRVVEEKVDRYYKEALEPLAEKYLFELPRRAGGAKERPTVLILGNHSSGKSAFINHVLKADVQRTGLAPVDDGFTIITYGEEEKEMDGPALVSHPEYPYAFLERFGPQLVSRVRFKARPVELLRRVTLIDSPGMIDSVDDAKNDRGYDFISVVRRLAEAADIVMLFFDPDKPGTTGETLTALRESLSGMDHKLLVVMNKVDRFENMRDFARAYGALCWNLARTMVGKDMPHIYSTYVPVGGGQAGSKDFPVSDFDISRREIVREVENAPSRRAHNMVSDLYQTARMLDTHVRVCTRTAWDLMTARLSYWGLMAVTVLLSVGLVLLLTRTTEGLAAPVYAGVAGAVLAALIFGVCRFDIKRRKASAAAGLDEVFRRVFRLQLTVRAESQDVDLTSIWQKTRDRVIRSLKARGPANAKFLFPGRTKLRRLAELIETGIPSLRKQVSKSEKRPD